MLISRALILALIGTLSAGFGSVMLAHRRSQGKIVIIVGLVAIVAVCGWFVRDDYRREKRGLSP